MRGATVADTKDKIFCLGDSRTGTHSLHFYLQNNGRKAIHYFVADAGTTDPLHADIEGNRAATLNFVRDSGYDAFTDYPTRFFWRELAMEYPSAHFILTTRKDQQTWLNSAKTFFEKFNVAVDYEELAYFHSDENNKIRQFFIEGNYKFLELCIDDGDEANSRKLAAFLDFDGSVKLARENATANVVMDEVSQRATVWGDSPLSLTRLSSMVHDGKALLGEYGWLYLARDSNDFMGYQFGESVWSDAETAAAEAVMAQRISQIEALGMKYLKFIVPEKSIIYREYMPRALRDYRTCEERPATILRNKFDKNVFYLDKYLQDAKSYGNVYFRGDTHPNWMGAYFIYRYIVDRLNLWKISDSALLDFKDLAPSLAGYEGDLYGQLEEKQKRILQKEWGFLLPENGFELAIKLDIPGHIDRAVRVNSSDDKNYQFSKRETFVYETGNSALPKAVIFRDSMFDFVHPLLAQHFSRSVFVWHEGAVIADIIEREQPDVIIHGMAERFVSAYPRFQPMVRLGT